jgi:hypothetical protein
MEKLKNMKETLMNNIQMQMGHLETVDTKELGEAIDMVKDLAEAIYYCTITEAMTEKDDKKKEYHYYTEKYVPMDQKYPDNHMPSKNSMNGRMYYEDCWYPYGYPPIYYYGEGGAMNGNAGGHNGDNGTRGYYERDAVVPMHDEREGRSHLSRRTYMETKEMHSDKNVKLKELEKYMQELTADMVDMIHDASPEEKQLLEKRITALATKIGQTNV